MGQTSQEIYTQECEAANIYMLEMIDCQMSQMQKTQSQARIIAGVHRPNYRWTNDHERCTMGTKASIKIAALNIRGMGNMNMWHPDNKWNHVNQVMNTKHIAIMVVGEAHLNNEQRIAIENMPRGRLRVLHSEDPILPNSKGVAIILNKGLTKTEKITATKVIPGRALLVETCWHKDEKLSILGVYAPVNPVENARFWG